MRCKDADAKDRYTQTKQDWGPLDRWETYAYMTLFQKLYTGMIKDLIMQIYVQDTMKKLITCISFMNLHFGSNS